MCFVPLIMLTSCSSHGRVGQPDAEKIILECSFDMHCDDLDDISSCSSVSPQSFVLHREPSYNSENEMNIVSSDHCGSDCFEVFERKPVGETILFASRSFTDLSFTPSDRSARMNYRQNMRDGSVETFSYLGTCLVGAAF